VATTFKELKRRTLLGMANPGGETLLIVEQAINDAQKNIARIKDFDDLIVLNTADALTVDGTKSYHIETDLLLTRPKDIYSIRLMSDSDSRKLTYVPSSQLDEKIPYTEQSGKGKSYWYTRRGHNIELYRIPDDAYALYILHSQWPPLLTADGQETCYADLDDVIVSLAKDISRAYVEGIPIDMIAQARGYLGLALREETTRPDEKLVAQPFSLGASVSGEYWSNPFIKRDP